MVDHSLRIRRARRGVTIATSLAAALALSLTGVSAASAASAASSPSRTSYPGSVPGWAVAANDEGPAPTDETFEAQFYLPLRNQAGAEALAKAVSTPGVGYRLGLTPAQWIARFSPSKADLDEVVGFLKGAGFTISAVPASRQYVVFRGTAEQFDDAFATSMHSYSHAGATLVAPSKVPSLPASLGAKVSALGLDQVRTLTRPDSIKQGDFPGDGALSRRVATTPVITTPCSNYIGEHTVTVPVAYGKTKYSTYNCGYTPAQLRSAYGISALPKSQNGAGQTVAIIDAYASPSIVSDVNTYSKALGEPGFARGQYQQIVPNPKQFVDQEACGLPSGWQGEQTLDVEAVHALAPGAKVLYLGGFNCSGGLDISLSKVLDGKLANIVSNSYGYIGEDVGEDVLAGESNLYIQAAGEGIGLYFSSGDDGDEVANLGVAEPDFSASSPWVTAVGGTAMGIDKKGKIAFETGWGDTLDKIVADPTAPGGLAYLETLPGSIFAGGAGGGVSTVFAQPWYQRGIVPASLAQGKRVSPDIAALADPYTGFSIGISPIVDDETLETGDFENDTYGGTSLASPLVAAQIALVQQGTRSTIGFANPTLYALDRVLPSGFRDVLPQHPPQAVVYTGAVSGNTYLITLDRDSSLVTTP